MPSPTSETLWRQCDLATICGSILHRSKQLEIFLLLAQMSPTRPEQQATFRPTEWGSFPLICREVQLSGQGQNRCISRYLYKINNTTAQLTKNWYSVCDCGNAYAVCSRTATFTLYLNVYAKRYNNPRFYHSSGPRVNSEPQWLEKYILNNAFQSQGQFGGSGIKNYSLV